MRTIDNYLDNEYRNYAEEVSFGRALPSIIDGMKPVRRKIFYYMKKNKNAGFIRVSSIAGGLAEKCNYHHGESSAQNTIISMAKDFPSSNNLPLLEGKGAFGSKLLPNSAAQARYIQAKYNHINEYIFLDDDLTPPNKDLDSPEPNFFLPIIPTYLINGISGIGIGYAVKIFPRSISHVIEAVEDCLMSKPIKTILPSYNNCNYAIEAVTDCSFKMSGKYTLNKNLLIITELIPGTDRTKFVEKLIDMQEKEIIKSFNDESKEDFKFVIILNKAIEKIEDAFSISKIFHENYTVLDEHNTIKVFNNVAEIIEYFVNYRLTIYTKRKVAIVKEFERNIARIEAIKLFIKNIKFVIEAKDTDEIKAFFLNKISEENIDYCLKKPLHSFMKLNLTTLQDEIDSYKKQIVYYNNVTEKELYLKDISKLKEELKNAK